MNSIQPVESAEDVAKEVAKLVQEKVWEDATIAKKSVTLKKMNV